ncbi:hypothetical protein M758_UG106100 [Ceratodon purpureus]|nr:hypothetical protein M758_UG106100 [Ceratodon purpureus]
MKITCDLLYQRRYNSLQHGIQRHGRRTRLRTTLKFASLIARTLSTSSCIISLTYLSSDDVSLKGVMINGIDNLHIGAIRIPPSAVTISIAKFRCRSVCHDLRLNVTISANIWIWDQLEITKTVSSILSMDLFLVVWYVHSFFLFY